MLKDIKKKLHTNTDTHTHKISNKDIKKHVKMRKKILIAIRARSAVIYLRMMAETAMPIYYLSKSTRTTTFNDLFPL